MSSKIFFCILVLLTSGLNTAGQILLKYGVTNSFFNLYLLGGILAYGLSTIVYILVLSKLNLSVVYPVVIGLTVISTTLASIIFFQEKVSVPHWMGVGLILSGICTVVFGKIS
ncbi:SMR family transporter [Acaryochloris sp. IP29b_bin.137]|uniref:DMT family transporter n=1 Tax=Acaryochloris sp. IP29b_bin.137 TaxID=2969217 RepID=UPI002602DBFD|nr:SMR family transporter [Acaryochloris sp. IP29b_bin.137]